jgi:hypothetical protein
MSHEEYIRSELEEKIAAMQQTIETIENRMSYCEDQLVTNLTLTDDAKIAYRIELMGHEEDIKSKRAQLNELLMQTARTKQ